MSTSFFREEKVLNPNTHLNVELIRYRDTSEFLRESKSYLVNKESINNLILGNCLEIINNADRCDKEPYFSVVKDKDELLLTSMMMAPFSIILYSHKSDYKKEVELIVKNLIEEKIEVPSVIGPVNLSKLFATIWSEETGCKVLEGLDMRVYELVKVNNVSISNGKFNIAKQEDLEVISKWIIDMEKEEGSMISEERAIEIAQDRIKNRQLFIWEDGSPVSMACTTRPTFNGVVVNMVYTPKEYRGNGYATSCVATLSQYLLDKGYKFCSLFTDLSNSTSNGIYIKIGYKPVCDFKGYTFKFNDL